MLSHGRKNTYNSHAFQLCAQCQADGEHRAVREPFHLGMAAAAAEGPGTCSPSRRAPNQLPVSAVARGTVTAAPPQRPQAVGKPESSRSPRRATAGGGSGLSEGAGGWRPGLRSL